MVSIPRKDVHSGVAAQLLQQSVQPLWEITWAGIILAYVFQSDQSGWRLPLVQLIHLLPLFCWDSGAHERSEPAMAVGI